MIDCDSLVYRHVAMNKDIEPGVVLAECVYFMFV